jgi:4-amino-4-deoxy-L-arabinose transferase-like glycosyltransferase
MFSAYTQKLKQFIVYLLGSIFLYCAMAPVYSNLSSYFHYKLGIIISAIIFPLVMLIVIYIANKNFKKLASVFYKLPQKITIIHVILFALLIRVIWIILVDNSNVHPDNLDLRAKALFDSGKLLKFSLEKPMGTPIITAIQYFIFGYNRFSGLFLQVIASLLEIYLVYTILKKTISSRAGLVAAIVLSIHPESVFFSNLIFSDTFFSVLVLSIFYLLFFFDKLWVYILTGFLAAISYYIRPVIILPLVIIFPFILYKSLKNRYTTNFTIKLFLFVSIFVIVMIPQIKFNYEATKSISISTSKQLGLSLAFATSPYHFARCNNRDVAEINKIITKNKESINMFSKDKYGKRLAFERFKEKPLSLILKSILIKPYLLWGNPGAAQACVGGVKNGILKKLLLGISLVFNKFILIFSGLVLLKNILIRKNNFILLLVSYALLVTASQLFLECQPRYSHMFIPLQCMLIGMISQYKRINN